MQSHLLAVPEIFVGYRNDSDKDGRLEIVRTKLIRTEDIRPANFEEQIERGYKLLKELRERLCGSSTEGMRSTGLTREANSSNADRIWKIAIEKWSLRSVKQLDDAKAQKVKKRREDPSRPVKRIGIVPKVLVQAIRVGKRAGRILV